MSMEVCDIGELLRDADMRDHIQALRDAIVRDDAMKEHDILASIDEHWGRRQQGIAVPMPLPGELVKYVEDMAADKHHELPDADDYGSDLWAARTIIAIYVEEKGPSGSCHVGHSSIRDHLALLKMAAATGNFDTIPKVTAGIYSKWLELQRSGAPPVRLHKEHVKYVEAFLQCVGAGHVLDRSEKDYGSDHWAARVITQVFSKLA